MPESMEEVLRRRIQRKHCIIVTGRFHIMHGLRIWRNRIHVMKLSVDITQLTPLWFYMITNRK